jgi:L-ascorbate metabolism protein UlaG (beta-lactamase superfamily)
MKITKHPHAHLAITEAGQQLIIDPGMFSAKLGDIANVVAVVVTHNHADHFSAEHLKAIQAASPGVKIFATPEVADEFPAAIVVAHGEQVDVGPFSLAFFGSDHAAIHSSVPVPHNIGVFVNNLLFYPGDAFTVPVEHVQILAVPGNAPWATVGEAMDYIASLRPAIAFPTHNGLLSDAGSAVYNMHLSNISKKSGTEFRSLRPGESIEL